MQAGIVLLVPRLALDVDSDALRVLLCRRALGRAWRLPRPSAVLPELLLESDGVHAELDEPFALLGVLAPPLEDDDLPCALLQVLLDLKEPLELVRRLHVLLRLLIDLSPLLIDEFL